MAAIRKIFIDDDHFIHQVLQKQLNIRFAATHNIIYEELHVKKLVFSCVPHYLTERQKAKSVRNYKLQNNP